MDAFTNKRMTAMLEELEGINRDARSQSDSDTQQMVTDEVVMELRSALTDWIPKLQGWADFLERNPPDESTIDKLETTPVSDGSTIRQVLEGHCYLLKGLISIVKPPTALESFTETLTTIIGTLGNVRSQHHFEPRATSDGTIYSLYHGSVWTFNSTTLPQFAMIIRDLTSKVEDILAET